MKPSSHLRHFNRHSLIVAAFLLPSLLGTSIFILIPLLDALRRSFFSSMGSRFSGVNAYSAVFRNEAFRLAAWNTGKFVVICIPLLLITSFGLALLLMTVPDPYGIRKTSFLVPLAIPAASMVAIFQLLFDRSGISNYLYGTTTNWLSSPVTFWVLVGTYLWKNCGYNMILWLAGLYSIPQSHYEAARVDGAGWWSQLWFITLPGVRPYLFTITTLSLLNSFKVFREAYLLGGNYPHESIYLLQHLFNHWFSSLDIDRLCAAASLLAAAILSLILLLSWSLKERANAYEK